MIPGMNRFVFAAAIPLALCACTTTPPSKWVEGGARLAFPRARWVVGDTAIDVVPNGAVFANSEIILKIDGSGRVTDQNNAPVALLQADGKLVGNGDELLGNVGIVNASLPDEDRAWITVLPTGEVLRYMEDGERLNFGAWLGCGAPQVHLTCTLITHLLGMRIKEEQDRARAMGTYYRGSPISTTNGMGLGPPY